MHMLKEISHVINLWLYYIERVYKSKLTYSNAKNKNKK